MSEKHTFSAEDIENLDFGKYEGSYSEDGLWEKIRGNVAKIGAKAIYQALILYYVAQSPECPPQVKALIIGALGYLISPLDLIPDMVPVVGYMDDAAVLLAILKLVTMYISDEIRAQAREKLVNLFGADVLVHIED